MSQCHILFQVTQQRGALRSITTDLDCVQTIFLFLNPFYFPPTTCQHIRYSTNNEKKYGNIRYNKIQYEHLYVLMVLLRVEVV